MSMHSRLNWNLEELVFKERGKLEYLEENLSEERREPTTNSTQIWHPHQDSNTGNTGGDECSHHCATFPPRVFSWVWMLHYTFTCYDLYVLLLRELWYLCIVSISSRFSVTMNVDFHIFSSVFVFFGNLDATTVNVVLFSPWKLQQQKTYTFLSVDIFSSWKPQFYSWSYRIPNRKKKIQLIKCGYLYYPHKTIMSSDSSSTSHRMELFCNR